MTRRHALFAVQAVVTAVLLWLLFRGIDWTAFGATLAGVPPLFHLAAFTAIVAGQALYAWRWQVVLAGLGLHVSYREVVEQYLMGLFFGNLMPTAVGGDAAKVYYLGRRVGFVQVGASVLVDRFLGFLWLSVMGAVLAWTIGAPTPILEFNRNLLSGFAVVFAGLLVILWTVPVGRLIPAFVRRPRIAGLIERVEELAGALRAGGCRPASLAVSGVVMLIYMTMLSTVYLAYFAASGHPVPGLLPVMNAIISMAILVNVPVSVNGIGLREQLHFLLFAEMGLPKEVSVSLSLLIFGYSLVLSAAGYFVWLRLQPSPANAA